MSKSSIKHPDKKKLSVLERAKGFLFAYKWLVAFFVPFLIIQLFHISHIAWDTTAYIFGGKWFCGNQVYFEFIRPPLPSFLNCVFGAGDYAMLLTTAFAAVVYFAAMVIIFSRNKDKLNQFIFALIAFLFPSILFASNYGSDLPALAFLCLAFAVLSPWKKGIAFALATLSRYNFLVFIIVFFFEFRKKPKNIVKFIIPIIVLWLPWMIYNYLFTGNPFFSIYESSFLNVQMKGIIAPFNMDQMLVIGAFIILLIWAKLKDRKIHELDITGVIGGAMFALSGIKELRFINMLVPGIAFNAALIAKKNKKALILFLVIFALFFVSASYGFLTSAGYTSPAIPNDSFVKNCEIASDKWVYFYYEGIIAECSYDIGDWNAFVENGGSFVLYDYNAYNLSAVKGKVINRGEYVLIAPLNGKCMPQPKKYISGSLRNYLIKWLRDTNSTIYDYSDWVG
jgi:hypothetical protein